MARVRPPTADTAAAALESREARTADAGERLGDVLGKLGPTEEGPCLVLEGSEPVGALHAVSALARLDALDAPVREVMAPAPPTLPEDATVADAVLAMLQVNQGAVLLPQDGGPLRVVTAHDVLMFLGQSTPELIMNLDPAPSAPLRKPEGG